MSTNDKEKPGGFTRRNRLLQIEKEVQQLWEVEKAYEVDAPAEWGKNKNNEKFFCTFPYPYMNGRLHLGHAFTITKAEFQARFQRLLGKRVLWPFAFHCTGMPIAACADKLKREVAEMKNKADGDCEMDEPAHVANGTTEQASTVGDIKEAGQFKGKKSKAVAKTGAAVGQWAIMRTMDVPEEEIPSFADPYHWLAYFPPLAKEDLTAFGMSVDWRRSFITTDLNPYYDAFIRWQFNRLKSKERIKFGKRHCIFSRIDGQPCADHDRASGEGVGPQEYTLIKLKVQGMTGRWPAAAQAHSGLKEAIKEGRVFLVAATLRPETMYGQTNCYVLPDGTYGMYMTATGNEMFICSHRSAINMAYQEILQSAAAKLSDKDVLEPVKVIDITGSELMGTPLSAPNAIFPTVYTLPMFGISMDKGTGVVTSVPSDAPDDWAALKDLKDKAPLREKYGITEEMVAFDVVEIIDIPGYGRQAAVKLCQDKKIQSQNDKNKLAEAKQEVYMKGFYEGVMLVGSQKGKKVCDAKAVVREELLSKGHAAAYWEPEKQVMSRSGDECIVALSDQWYLDYGEAAWKAAVEAHINDPSKFNAYAPQAYNQFVHVVSWLREWACSRAYGLGTRLPWDPAVVIESLSDSTIYMAYYAIAHILQNGIIDGANGNAGPVKAADLSDEVFDYVFMQTDKPPHGSKVPMGLVEDMRREFSYWYPMDLRVSGKDLIPNHLTMSLYNHAAIWDKKPDLWPRSFFSNGHVMVDAEKMSKSKGNFLTLQQAIETFAADATRLACADAGDALDDANYSKEVANSAIMKLFLLEQFVTEVAAGGSNLRTGPKTSVDHSFENEVNALTRDAKAAYLKLSYRDALKAGFYDFLNLKDEYIVFCGKAGLHKESITTWVDAQVKILSPICPHICEYLWSFVLKKKDTKGILVKQTWPKEKEVDPIMHRQYQTLKSSLADFRLLRDKAMGAGAKAKGGKQPKKEEAAPAEKDKKMYGVIYVAKSYLPLQQRVLTALQKLELDENYEPVQKDYLQKLKVSPELAGENANTVKNALQFASFQMKEVKVRGRSALELELPFSERDLMVSNKDIICKQLSLEGIEVLENTQAHPADASDKRTTAVPSRPAIFFYQE